MLKGVILNHFLLLPSVVQKDTYTIKLFQDDHKKDRNCVDVKKQLRQQTSAVPTQLPMTRLCWAITHLCLLVLPMSVWLHSFLVICVTFCDSLLPFPHSVPSTSKQISSQEIAMFWMQQVHIKKLAATPNFAGWKMGIMSYRNYVWLSDSKLQGVIIWCVLLTDPRTMMYLFYKGRKSVKCLQVI